MEFPGSYQESSNPEPSLNTPIKRIQNLTLNSPTSPLYPCIDDIFGTSSDVQTRTGSGMFESSNSYGNDERFSPVASSMLDRGYSKKITNNVLLELNSRASQISQLLKSPTTSARSADTPATRRAKRYSGIHHTKFQQMDSISQHYSVHVQSSKQKSPSRQQNSNNINNLNNTTSMNMKDEEMPESSSKRRRTLTGIEPIMNPLTLASSPDKLNSSPIRKISPSKKSMNLHSLLSEPETLHNSTYQSSNTTLHSSPIREKGFVKPFPPSNKLRISSLQMAGVGTPQLQKKSSIPQLQKKLSNSQLQKTTSIPQLHKKPSIPNLLKKSSTTNLQQKPSISNLHRPEQNYLQPKLTKKSSIPQLQKKLSIPNLSYNTKISSSMSTTSMGPSRIPTSKSSRQISPSSSSKSLSAAILGKSQKINTEYHSTQHKITTSSSTTSFSNNKVTVPQPFSLYDKPTISSSQKSLNRFQRFRDKFN